MEEPLLKIQGLTVSFDLEEEQVVATNGVSLDLHKQEVIGIVGESGSGKSVTSLATMGLIPQPPGKLLGGKILFSQQGVWKNLLKKEVVKTYRGRKIAMIFQEPMTSLNPVHKCGRQVAEMILAHENVSKRVAQQRTLELFREVQLPRPEKLAQSYPHQLSGGQRQRVMIAMAIACKPEVLIADEPTTALDVTVQKSVLFLLKKLQRKYGMSLIFISHDLGVISKIATKVVVMYKGEIVEQGTVEEVFKNPKHRYTRGLLACRPSVEQRVIKLPTVSEYLNTRTELQLEFEEPAARTHRLAKLYSNEPLIRVHDLCVEFPLRRNFFGKPTKTLKAVDHVSLEIYKGETLGLVGESGCGKTTFGRSVLKLSPAASGKVMYGHSDVLKMSSRELHSFRKTAQIIFQDPYSSLNPRITIGNAIAEVMRVHQIRPTRKERKEYVVDLLTKVGLGAEYFNRYPHNLSGGQRQRACIARTLALNPEFVVCDESVSALDVSVQAQVLNLLNDLKKEFNLTYLFISHDLSVTKYISDRIAVMDAGKILELGEADSLFNNPKEAKTKELIGSIL